MIVYKQDEVYVKGRGKVFIVSSNYFKLLNKDDKICVDGKYYLVRGIEATQPLGNTIGLIVREIDND